MKKPELLAPGGSLEKLKTAIDYGADAVYIGGEMFSLRVAAENFSKEDMQEGIKYAHDRGKKVYLTANILPHNDDIEEFEEFVKDIKNYGFDAVLVADLGLFDMMQELAPEIPIHVSTQANNINYRSAIKWYKMGATRVVLAREMSFKEIAEFQKKIPEDLELEAFIHGAMCISYSGRCLLSNYMTGRDSNMGACAHPCRWNYKLVEETRPGEYMDVFENERLLIMLQRLSGRTDARLTDIVPIPKIMCLMRRNTKNFARSVTDRIQQVFISASRMKIHRFTRQVRISEITTLSV